MKKGMVQAMYSLTVFEMVGNYKGCTTIKTKAAVPGSRESILCIFVDYCDFSIVIVV